MTDQTSLSGRVFVTSVVAVAVVATAWFAWRGLTALLVIFAGVLLAVLLRSLAQALQRWRPLGDTAALAVVCLGLLLLAGGGAVLVAAPLQQQSAELIDALPRAWRQLRDQIAGWPLGQRLLAMVSDPEQLTATGGPAAQRVMRAVSNGVSIVGYLVLMLFVGLFMAAEPALYRRGLLRLFPVRRRPRLEEVLLEAGEGLQRWLLGRAFLMVVIAVLTWIGLLALGIPMALALAVLAGALTFIPNFGPVVAAVPAMLLALLESPMHVVYVAGLYLGIQTVESYTLEPYVMRKADDLPPALVIAGQLFLGVTLGTLGFVIATPLIVVLAVMVRRLYVEDTLES
ncbi:MAG TPA: AI-2E family transporter [Luteitalea sp.]|nr:AI-2E family transporter [Luteitalea sp.]